jgi:hypothetical protein
MGSPVRGSRFARYLTQRGMTWALGQSGPGGLAAEHDPVWKQKRDLGIVAGTYELRFNPLNPKLPSPNDGIVAVEETRIEGAKDSVMVHSNHTGMLFTRELAEQICTFLTQGMFNHQDIS